jgi:ADP-ribose diphosphatase
VPIEPDFKWTTLVSERVFDCRVFSITRYARANSRKQGDFFVLSGNEWVNIIPVTRNNEIVMVEQFRHGTQEVTLEIPGGLVDDADVDALAAARREMNEECGYDSKEIEFLGTISPNPAIQSNYCHSYIAKNAELTMDLNPDEFEELRVRLVAAADIPGLIKSGAINHALVVVAFSFFGLHHLS